MVSDTCSYSGISHVSCIQQWQKTVYPESGSLMFAFTGARAEYREVRDALTHHYGEDAFDAMRKLECTEGSYTIIVEAHFTRAADRTRELSKALLKNESFALSIRSKKVAFQGGSKKVKFKVFPCVPILGQFTVYQIQGLPLGPSSEVCSITRKSVIDMLMSKLAKYEKKDVMRNLIDIVPGYDKSGDTHLFDGTLTVVLKDFIGVFLEFDSIVLFGKMFKPTANSTHYIYCKRCKTLDSHLTDDCPYRTKTTHI